MEDFQNDQQFEISKVVFNSPYPLYLPDDSLGQTFESRADIEDGDLHMIAMPEFGEVDTSGRLYEYYSRIDAYFPFEGVDADDPLKIEVRFKDGIFYRNAAFEPPGPRYEYLRQGTKTVVVRDGRSYYLEKAEVMYDGSTVWDADSLLGTTIEFRFKRNAKGWSASTEPEIEGLDMRSDTTSLADGLYLQHNARHYMNYEGTEWVAPLESIVDWVKVSKK